jgi:uncharacterized membrane protein YjgN (DUF898 family)
LITLSFAVTAAGMTAKSGAGIDGGMVVPVVAGIFAFYAGLFALVAYIKARTTNAVWSHLSVGPLRFESRLRARDLMWLYLSNFLVVVLTLGLAAPWAVVRMARYRAAKTTAIATGALDSFVQAEGRQVSAAGQEVGEMFDVDVAL